MRRPRPIRTPLTAALAAACVLLGGCDYLSNQPAATIGSRSITVTQLNDALKTFESTVQYRQLSSQGSPAQAQRQFEQGYLSNMIREHVVRAAASHFGIGASAAEVRSRIQQLKQNYANEKEFEGAVSQQGLTIGQLTRLVRDQVLQDKLRRRVTRSIHVDRARIRSYYRAHKADFREAHVAHISVPPDKFKLATRISARLNKAPDQKLDSLFSRMARRYSQDTNSAASGGDIGELSLSRLDPHVRQVLRHLKPGQVSYPVNTQQGFEIFRVLSAHLLTLGQVAPQIRQRLVARLQERAWEAWLQRRYRALGVHINPRFGKLDQSSLTVVDVPPQDFPNGAKPHPTSTVSGQPPAPLGG